MLDIKRAQAEGERLTAEIGGFLGAELTPELATKLFEIALGPTCVELYKVAIVYANEADKCRNSEAYFSAALMIASSVESLLALMCFINREDVGHSREYKAWKIKKNRTFEENVLHAYFQDYIAVADAFNWVPSDAVDSDLLRAVSIDLPIVFRGLYPRDTIEEAENRASAFRAKPGITMLETLRDMRNLIHGPRWPREGLKAGSPGFHDDCKFAFVISFQVMSCLFETLVRMSKSRMAQISSMRTQISPAEQDRLRAHMQEIMGVSLPAK